MLPGSYTDPKEHTYRTVLGQLTYGIWNEDAYQLYMDLETLRLLIDQVDPESLRADHIASAREQATLAADIEQPLPERIRAGPETGFVSCQRLDSSPVLCHR